MAFSFLIYRLRLDPNNEREARISRFYGEHCVYLPAMLGWFFFSACISAYNKKVFGSGNMKFPCPLLLTSIHFLLQWVFSYAVSEKFPEYFGGERVRTMTWKEFAIVSVPCGFITALDVGMSNLSLVRISLTFYTMIKASTPIFVLIWAYLFNIERITWMLTLVVAIISFGEFFTVMGETEFDLVGFILCLSASCFSGARWTLVQLQLKGLDPPLKTSVATMRVISPSMFISMFVISLIMEKPWNSLRGTGNSDEMLLTLALGVGGAIFAISMLLCEFSLVMRASAIVLMIGGVIKEMITISVGLFFFHDVINAINCIGFAIVFMGVILYKVQLHFGDKHTDQPYIKAANTDEEFYNEMKEGLAGTDDQEKRVMVEMSNSSQSDTTKLSQ